MGVRVRRGLDRVLRGVDPRDVGDYRDDRHAALVRSEELARENALLRGELSALRQSRASSRGPGGSRLGFALVTVGLIAVALGFAALARPAVVTPTPPVPSVASPPPRSLWTMPRSIAHTALHGVARVGDETWGVGDRGTILLRATPMSPWTRVSSGTDADLYAITAGPPLVAVGAHGTVLRFNAESRQWEREDAHTREDLYAVAIRGRTSIAVGARGTVVARVEGSPWSRQCGARVTSDDLFGVSMGDAGAVAVGASGAIVRFGEQGYEVDGDPPFLVVELFCERATTPTSATLRAITHWRGTYVAVGDRGAIVYGDSAIAYGEGENPWTLAPGASSDDLFAVGALDVPSELLALGDTGRVNTLVAAGAAGVVIADRAGLVRDWRVVRSGGDAVSALLPSVGEFFTSGARVFASAAQ